MINIKPGESFNHYYVKLLILIWRMLVFLPMKWALEKQYFEADTALFYLRIVEAWGGLWLVAKFYLLHEITNEISAPRHK